MAAARAPTNRGRSSSGAARPAGRGWPPVAGAGTLCFLLGACSTVSGPVPQRGDVRDGPPPESRDVSAIPDAVPHWEPPSRYGNPEFYNVNGKLYRVLPDSGGYVERGIASWYGWKFHGRRTSAGEPYDVWGMTAAHRTLPIPCYARVTNLLNGRRVVVRINDRGPFEDDRLIDLSYAAASKLGIVPTGTAPVEVRVVSVPSTRAVGTDLTVTEGGPLYLQAGAFQAYANARRVQQRLRAAHIQPVQILPGRSGASALYRVRVGPIPDPTEVERFYQRVIGLGLPEPLLVVD
jgi:rare lipoprotein A